MSSYDPYRRRRFQRNRDRGMVAGVCAGLADYFGFNLRVTRILAFISLLLAMPLTLIVYFGIVFLFPAGPGYEEPVHDREFRQAVRSDPAATLNQVKRRFQSLDNRLARLERYVTSPRFNLDEEFRRL